MYRQHRLMIAAAVLLAFVPLSGQRFRDRHVQPARVLDSLGVHAGMTVGEVGAGRGYFTFKLAARVGETGRVIANDIDREALAALARSASMAGFENIDTLLGNVIDPQFEPHSLDMAVMVYVFHDLTQPVALMRQLKRALKPSAVVAILDRDPERYLPGRAHFMKKRVILAHLAEAGYVVERIYTFLDRDNIYVTRPKLTY